MIMICQFLFDHYFTIQEFCWLRLLKLSPFSPGCLHDICDGFIFLLGFKKLILHNNSKEIQAQDKKK